MKSKQLLHSYWMSFTDVEWTFSSEKGELEVVLSPGVHKAPSPGLTRPHPAEAQVWVGSGSHPLTLGLDPGPKGLVCLGREGKGAGLPSACPSLAVTSGDALS